MCRAFAVTVAIAIPNTTAVPICRSLRCVGNKLLCRCGEALNRTTGPVTCSSTTARCGTSRAPVRSSTLGRARAYLPGRRIFPRLVRVYSALCDGPQPPSPLLLVPQSYSDSSSYSLSSPRFNPRGRFLFGRSEKSLDDLIQLWY